MEISEYRLRNGTIMMLGEDYGIKRKKYETDEEWVERIVMTLNREYEINGSLQTKHNDMFKENDI